MGQNLTPSVNVNEQMKESKCNLQNTLLFEFQKLRTLQSQSAIHLLEYLWSVVDRIERNEVISKRWYPQNLKSTDNELHSVTQVFKA